MKCFKIIEQKFSGNVRCYKCTIDELICLASLENKRIFGDFHNDTQKQD